jgi:hypothetical protein
MIDFSEFIGIDWSGSREYARGEDGEFPIQIASCESSEGVLELHQPTDIHNPRWQDNRWSRTTVFNWLIDRVRANVQGTGPILIGFDFALSFPFTDKKSFFPGEDPPTETWQDLLELLGSKAGIDFDPSPFIDDAFYKRFFLTNANRGTDYLPRHRVTERPEYLQDLSPANVFKLIGGDQVGRGSVSGLAMIRSLKASLGEDLFLWPFEGIVPNSKAKAVVVEIWPRMLYEMVGVPPNSHRYPLVFKLALKLCGISNLETLAPPLGENSGDAMLAAAALRHLKAQQAIWDAPKLLAASDFQLEGWIWGAK